MKRDDTLRRRLKNGDFLLFDGALGTELIERGLARGECPEPWNLERGEKVADVARAYAAPFPDTRYRAGARRFPLLVMTDPDMEGVEVDFREDGLRAIAEKGMERKTGARGLRSILEGVLLDSMYNIPSRDDVSKVVIDESVIRGDSEPLLVYQNSEPAARAAAPDE